jgi:formylglycine-generating enzyme required for sulfatase activity
MLYAGVAGVLPKFRPPCRSMTSPHVALYPWRDLANAAGQGSSLAGLWDHPVVHQSPGATWRPTRNGPARTCPPEAEWEFAARGGLHGAEYAGATSCIRRAGPWPTPGRARFRGEFSRPGRAFRTSRVGAYSAQWLRPLRHDRKRLEWTKDWWGLPSAQGHACCDLPPGRKGRPSPHPDGPKRFRAWVLKGGSHLSPPSYCRRYRPAGAPRAARGHVHIAVGFRCGAPVDPRQGGGEWTP